MLYIDFDGVILDTEELLFQEWRKQPNHSLLPESEKIKYIQGVNWNFVLNGSACIADSIYCLKHMDPKKSAILTKVHSLENESVEKVKWIQKNGIKQSVILVPYPLKKTDMVDAVGSVLIDDCLKNLDDWKCHGGYPVFFDMNDDGYDSWNQPNVQGYSKVLSLKKYMNHR